MLPESLKIIFDEFVDSFVKSNSAISDEIKFTKNEKVQEVFPLCLDEEIIQTASFALGIRAYRLNYHKAIFCQETCTRYFDQKEDFEYALKNYSTERPITYPEGKRENAISFTVLDCKNKLVGSYAKKYKKENGIVILDGDYFERLAEAGFGMVDEMIRYFIDGYQEAKRKLKK